MGLILFVLLVIAAAAVFFILKTRTDSNGRDIDPNLPMVALTFDDGPTAEWSPVILDCLEENNAVATFFEIGQNVDKYPELSKRAFEMGCEIGSHTYNHINLPSSSIETLDEDYALCSKAFRNAIGHMPKLMRPPEGALGGEAKRYYDVPFIGWSLDTEDWLTRNTESTVAKVKTFGNLDGQVVLMHSAYESTAYAAQEIIPWLIGEGYQLVTVSELLEYKYDIKPENHLYYAVDFFLYGRDAE